MSASPSNSKQKEADGTKEEEWEVVSGSKSLSLEASAPSENKENEKKEKEKDVTEEIPKEEDPIMEIKKAIEKVTRDEEEKEQEDWYETIPATPMNTPEYTPAPPSYPSSNRKLVVEKDLEGMELTTIEEELLGEPTQNNVSEENVLNPDDSQESLHDSDPNMLRKFIDVLSYGLTRLALFFIVFSLVKWTFTKACEKIRKMKARPEAK